MKDKKIIKVDIGREFAQTLSCRTKEDGEYSAEAFVYDLILPKLKEYDCIDLDFNNTNGYSSAFLEQAFSDLVFEMDMCYNSFTHKFNIITNDQFLEAEIIEYVKNPIKRMITPDMFKGYFVPTPIPNKYLSMELCELVDIDVDWDSVKEYWHTGEVINLVLNEEDNKYYLDTTLEQWFWHNEDGEENGYDQLSREYFHNHPNFRPIFSELYKELLEGKTYVGTMNSYMFLQRFSYIGDYIFE